jgi:non-ribosomal peptide synthase protein (TIGR01720 family)
LRLGAPIAEEPGETGQPDVTLRWTPPLGSWRAERVSVPPVAGAGPLRVDCRLEGGRLRADWTSAGIYQKEDLERIADRFREQLSALIRHCQSSGAGGFTPSDFPVSRLDQAELDELLAKLGQSME